MNSNSNAFVVNSTVPEETLIELTRAVDELDFYRMVIDVTVTEPETDRELVDYIERATMYLSFLRDRVEGDDLVRASTFPINESTTRRHITKVLRSCVRGTGS